MHQYLHGLEVYITEQNLDENEDLKKFVKNLEKTCIETVESGSMTKDLAILVGPDTKFLTTNQFLDVIDSNLKKRLDQNF